MSRKMKDSGVEWIGEIPEDWEVKQLRTYFSRRINKNIHLQEKNLLSLSYGRIVRKNIDTKEGLLPESFDGYNIIENGDIVIRGTDLQNDHRSLRTGLATERGIITSAYMTLRPQKDVNSTYYHYLLHCYDISKVFYSMGGGLRQSLDYWEFIRMPVLHSTDREQEEIVSYIKTKCTAIDTAIEKTKKSIEKLEEYKKAVITKAVTKGIDPNAKMKDSGVEWIGEIPEGMDIIRIKFISDIFGRIGFRGYTQDDLVNEGDGAISLSPSNLKSFRMSYDKCTYISWSKYEESPEIKIENGDILFVKTGSSYGKSCIVKDLPEKATINPQLIVFKNIKCNNKYLFYLLQTWIVDTQTQWYVTGGTIPTMSQDKIANFYLPYYKDNYKQQQIVHFLDRKCTAIDNAIEKKKKAIEKWEEYKKSLIYYAVTGKIDCRNEVI